MIHRHHSPGFQDKDVIVDYIGCSAKNYVNKWSRKFSLISASNRFSRLTIRQLVALTNAVNGEIDKMDLMKNLGGNIDNEYLKNLKMFKEKLMEALNMRRSEINFWLFGKELKLF